MNTKVLLGFVAGAALATAVFYGTHRERGPEAAAPTPQVNPVAAPVPIEPVPVAPAVAQPAPQETPKEAVKPVKAVKPHAKPVVVAQAPKPTPAAEEQQSPPPPPAPEELTPDPAVVAQDPAPPPAAPAAPEQLEPPQPNSVTFPAGTLITVRLAEPLASDRNETGDVFTASLDQALIQNGFVIAEKGARAEGRVVNVVPAGRVKGTAQLVIELTKIHTSDGQKVPIQTAHFERQGPESKGDDAAKVGIGAAIGAAIGAMAGGGKGAAIGAAAGGAAGGGVVAATRGRPAVLPVETKISFRLATPVTITEHLNARI